MIVLIIFIIIGSLIYLLASIKEMNRFKKERKRMEEKRIKEEWDKILYKNNLTQETLLKKINEIPDEDFEEV